MEIELLAPIAGKILKILVEAGETVSEDEEVLEIEAMKMGNPIYAPVSGTITEIAVKEDDEVEVDDLLLVIEQG